MFNRISTCNKNIIIIKIPSRYSSIFKYIPNKSHSYKEFKNGSKKYESFLKFQKDLNYLSETSKSSNEANKEIDKKTRILIDNSIFDIFDLNFKNDEESIDFFRKLISMDFNFNNHKIKGIEKFVESLSLRNVEFLEIVKNCGCEDKNDLTKIEKVFKDQYNESLRYTTIKILINRKQFDSAGFFLKLFKETEHYDAKKYQDLLAIFNLKYSMMIPINKMNNDTEKNIILLQKSIHLYLNQLTLKNFSNLTQEKKLENFLLILYKYFDSNLKLTNFQVQQINSSFLQLLNDQNGVNYKVFLGYFIKIYPSSIDILYNLKLLNKLKDSDLPNLHDLPNLQDLPNVNIRSDLIINNSYPFNRDIKLIYEKYFAEFDPNISQTRNLFEKYTKTVKNFQDLQNVKNNKLNSHPFNSTNHDSSILSEFLIYSLNKLDNFKISIKFIYSFFEKISYKSLNSYGIFQTMLTISKIDIINSINLINILNTRLNLPVEVYLNILNYLIKLGEIENAKKIFDFISNEKYLVDQLNFNQICLICEKYNWEYPKLLLKRYNDYPNGKLINQINYNDANDLNDEFYKFEKFQPEKIVELLDNIKR